MARFSVSIAKTTPYKPEVFMLGRKLGLTSDAVLGLLVRFWMWVDERADRDGLILGKDMFDVDDAVSFPGLALALCELGWLRVHVDQDRKPVALEIPNYLRHFSGGKVKSRHAMQKAEWRRKQRVLETLSTVAIARSNYNASETPESQLSADLSIESSLEMSANESGDVSSHKPQPDIDLGKIVRTSETLSAGSMTPEEEADLRKLENSVLNSLKSLDPGQFEVLCQIAQSDCVGDGRTWPGPFLDDPLVRYYLLRELSKWSPLGGNSS